MALSRIRDHAGMEAVLRQAVTLDFTEVELWTFGLGPHATLSVRANDVGWLIRGQTERAGAALAAVVVTQVSLITL